MQLISQFAADAEEKELQYLASQEQKKINKEDEMIMFELFSGYRPYKKGSKKDD